MSNIITSAGTDAQQSDTAEVPTSSQPCSNTFVSGSALIEGGAFKVGNFYNGREIKSTYEVKLSINKLGVIQWYVYGSKYKHKEFWMNGQVKEIHNYHFCSTCYYPTILFKDWGNYLHKTLQYQIAENCGFESPRAFADYLIDKYKEGFTGQLISFIDIEY